MEENLFDKLREMSGKSFERLNILEEQIDVKLQMEYFKYSQKFKKGHKSLDELEVTQVEDLNQPDLTLAKKKEILVKLASIDDPKAYRIIEEFSKTDDPSIHDWAILALQESKMLLESSLLDESQIFISTGLGGRGNMLRYFIVLIGDDISEFSGFQQKMVNSEFEFAMQKSNAELEMIYFEEQYVSMKALIPFDVPLQQLFKQTIEECNQYGNFLKSNFIITNVKELTILEIKDFINKSKSVKNNPLPGIDIEPIDDENDE
jgi:hypothetical protein